MSDCELSNRDFHTLTYFFNITVNINKDTYLNMLEGQCVNYNIP